MISNYITPQYSTICLSTNVNLSFIEKRLFPVSMALVNPDLIVNRIACAIEAACLGKFDLKVNPDSRTSWKQG